ncbi:MAG TPA: CAP domain-containing protein [Candidatus Absconditabacterales bacterium]|nr:CAP domain-containing protein [Candidatus Absconditabacterales bacterium]
MKPFMKNFIGGFLGVLLFSVVFLGFEIISNEAVAIQLDSTMKQKVESVFQIILRRSAGKEKTQLTRLVTLLDLYRPRLSDSQKIAIVDYLKELATQKLETLSVVSLANTGTTSNGSLFSGNYTATSIKNVDMNTVRQARLGWFNTERKLVGVPAYSYNARLDATALERSDYSKKNGTITHERNAGDGYYNYPVINQRFLDRGINPKNISRVTHSENIGRGVYKCSKADCTQNLITAIKSTFDFYMSEKGKSFRPHYNSMVNKYFGIIGLGISIDEAKGKYYLTVHYSTELQ